jgi:hypothetical protein
LNGADATEISDKSLDRCRLFVEQGRLAKAVDVLDQVVSKSGNIHTVTDAVLSELKNLHAHANPPIIPSSTLPASVCFKNDDIMSAVFSFKPGSAAGPSGLSPDFLKSLISGRLAEFMLTSFSKYASMFASGGFNPLFRQFAAAATLIPLKKPDGGVRPIAIGEVWRRVVCKCALRAFKSEVSDYFAPFQVGVGVRFGAESVVHAINTLLARDKDDPSVDNSVLQFDFKNAFNCVDRSVFIRLVREHFGVCLP